MTLGVIVSLVVMGALFMLLPIVLVRKMVHVASSNEILIVSGSQRTLGGKSVGYRAVKGGRVILLPLLEALDRLDATNLLVQERVAVRSKEFVPFGIDVTAAVRIAAEHPGLDKAATRLMGKSREELLQLADDAVVAATVGVVAKALPENLLEDRAKIEDMVANEAHQDLQRIGLEISVLRLGKITDEVGYLAAIGR